MNIDQPLKQKLQDLIAQANVSNAILLLLENPASPYYPQAVLISARFHELENKVHKNLLSRQDELLERAHIVDDLLHLITSDSSGNKIEPIAQQDATKTSVSGNNNIVISNIEGAQIHINTKEQ
ncbi:MAG: hypothetical protein WA004_10625 [Saprospiraceae bacterium]